MKLSRIAALAAAVAVVGVGLTAQRQATPAKPSAVKPADQAAGPVVDRDAASLADFEARIEAYMDLRKQAIKPAPPLEETDDPAKITAARDAMATRIRAARATAKHGDVFTPAIAAYLRRLLTPELKGEEGRDAKKILKDDAPPPASVPFKVNAKYPDGVPLPTVPANLLLSLPQLPEPLQYRIINKHLILLDADADVIVDYALNVIK